MTEEKGCRHTCWLCLPSPRHLPPGLLHRLSTPPVSTAPGWPTWHRVGQSVPCRPSTARSPSSLEIWPIPEGREWGLSRVSHPWARSRAPCYLLGALSPRAHGHLPEDMAEHRPSAASRHTEPMGELWPGPSLTAWLCSQPRLVPSEAGPPTTPARSFQCPSPTMGREGGERLFLPHQSEGGCGKTRLIHRRL